MPIRQLQGECLPCAVALSGVSAFTVTPSRPEDKTAGSSLVDVSCQALSFFFLCLLVICIYNVSAHPVLRALVYSLCVLLCVVIQKYSPT